MPAQLQPEGRGHKGIERSGRSAPAAKERVFHTCAVDIPVDVAEGVEDPEPRERLEKAAGTTEHSTTWNVPEPMVMNGIVLFESKDIYVSIAGRPTEDREAKLGEGERRPLRGDLDRRCGSDSVLAPVKDPPEPRTQVT